MAVLATYPGSYTVFGADEVDNIDNVFAIHINKVRAEILALQRTLGIGPQGDYPTVVARLNDMDLGVVHIARVEHITGPKTIDVCAVYNLVIPAPVALGTGLTQASFQIGLLTGPNLGFGVNQIECRNNNVTAPLTLNLNGGTVKTGGALQVGNSGTAALSAGTATVTLARVNSTGDVSLGSTTHGLQVGVTAAAHTAMDGNEIQARAAGGASASDLILQQASGKVQIGGPVRINVNGDARIGSTSHGLQIGSSNQPHIVIDGNEIMALGADGRPSELYLNLQGGDVSFKDGIIEYTEANGKRGWSSDECNVGLAFTPDYPWTPAGGQPTGELQATGWDFDGWCPMRASHFYQSSSETVKTDISPLPFSALATVENAPASMYHHAPTHADSSVVHIGPMAEALPPELVHNAETDPAISLMSMIGTLWAAVTELSAKVNVLAGTVDRLAGP